MSTAPEPDFDLEKLFLPAWAQDSPQVNRYADFAGEERSGRRSDDRHDRHSRPPPRRDQPGGPKPGGRRPEGARRNDRRTEERQQERPAQDRPAAAVPVTLLVLPEEKGVESLARQIRVTGRAYPCLTSPI